MKAAGKSLYYNNQSLTLHAEPAVDYTDRDDSGPIIIKSNDMSTAGRLLQVKSAVVGSSRTKVT
jgi:hypothetical protein